MKRFVLVLFLITMVFAMIGCTNTVGSESAPTSTIELQGCVEHDFSEARLLTPRRCLECNILDGEPLYKKCETWEDVIDCLYFDDMVYDLTVTEDGDSVTLVLYFTDTNQFATEDLIKDFMVKAFISLPDIIGFTQGSYMGTTIDTSDYFRKNVTVFLSVPGCAIAAVPYDGNLFGIATCLIPDGESTDITVFESAYHTAFGSTNVGYEIE